MLDKQGTVHVPVFPQGCFYPIPYLEWGKGATVPFITSSVDVDYFHFALKDHYKPIQHDPL